jgi:rare lipoprotein A
MMRGLVLSLISLWVLSGCAGYTALERPGSPTFENPNAGRYQLSQDRGPNRNLRPEDIPDIAMIHEPPSRGGNRDYTLFGQHYVIKQSAVGYVEEGFASWYGEKFHGHTTSNGEIYDMFSLSAAHRTLPLPTLARVTNLENGRSVVLRVNDRGPFHANRFIDLSYGAALRLGFVEQGVARVRVEALTPEYTGQPVRHAETYWLQFGAFQDASHAHQVRDLVDRTLQQQPQVQPAGSVFRVRLGPISAARAEDLQRQWVQRGHEAPLLIRTD